MHLFDWLYALHGMLISGPNFIELLSTKICLAWNFFLGKNRVTNQISICCILLVAGIQLLFAYPENHMEIWLVVLFLSRKKFHAEQIFVLSCSMKLGHGHLCPWILLCFFVFLVVTSWSCFWSFFDLRLVMIFVCSSLMFEVNGYIPHPSSQLFPLHLFYIRPFFHEVKALETIVHHFCFSLFFVNFLLIKKKLGTFARFAHLKWNVWPKDKLS